MTKAQETVTAFNASDPCEYCESRGFGVCELCERAETEQHEWQRGRFTGAVTCAKCGLLPLDDDDIHTECEPRDAS
jgi:hypothetical protein